jgi:hypothetical protein
VGTGETRLRPSRETAAGAAHRGGLGATNPISGVPVKWARVERESERSIVPVRARQQNRAGGKGPYLVCVRDGGKGR